MASDYWKKKVFVVTGGARGQGAAEVQRLLKLGSCVVAIDTLSPNDSEWKESHPCTENLQAVTGGVQEEETWREALERVRSFGLPLTGLVNNAGVSLRKLTTATSLDEWQRVLNINLTGAFLGIRSLAPTMIDGGSIVNISSTAGLIGYFSAAYTASKWGLRGLSRAAAIELAARKITVNTLCPGSVDSPMGSSPAGGYDTEQTRIFFESNRSMTPLARPGLPDEIAGAVIFLLGPDSRFITGIDLPVDGGMTGGGTYYHMGRRVGTVPG